MSENSSLPRQKNVTPIPPEPLDGLARERVAVNSKTDLRAFDELKEKMRRSLPWDRIQSEMKSCRGGLDSPSCGCQFAGKMCELVRGVGRNSDIFTGKWRTVPFSSALIRDPFRPLLIV